MQTQHSPEGNTSYIDPPLTMSISVGRPAKEVLDVIVTISTGRYSLMRRGVRVHEDAFGTMPGDVVAALCKWALFLSEAEAQRQRAIQGHLPERPVPHPEWPSPESFPRVDTVRGRRPSRLQR